ncbi:tryptophan-rich sensory protein [Amycolatopsis rhizosphaerae]|uniref:Tryptophan-rich sensory protein n=1 Tax=Amycolatopsis rhizosphaerae TaxID=2053003 RepID=A0A558B8Y2_9PSEU|nr:TspO/MBR family protein [Amycolatopsis rhizosphaerae]TVT32940.1 tryptophan-rich sensory protein [Amycolatopsis rhizosphaerae]
MDAHSARGLAFAAGPTLAAAAIGSLASRRAPEVYRRLAKPAWAPPPGVFGPVWTVLYTAIGVAGWRLWTRRAGRKALGLHLAQLALNAAWTPAFFAARNRTAALAVVTALDGALAAEIAVVARRDRAAAALLAPYLGWSVFATALTASVGDPAGPPGSTVRR